MFLLTYCEILYIQKYMQKEKRKTPKYNQPYK